MTSKKEEVFYMYQFSYVSSVAAKAVVVDQDLFHRVLSDQRIERICSQIAQTTDVDERSKLKRMLPAFCWQARYDGGVRKNETAHSSGLVMLDLDHVCRPSELWKTLQEACIQQGLLVAHITPSTQGLRLVFPVPEGMDLEQAQSYYVQELNLVNVDTCTKDYARLSFCVPQSYFLYVDEERLFSGSPSVVEEVSVEVEGQPVVVEPVSVEVAERPVAVEQTSAEGVKTVGKKADESESYETHYDGIPYSLLVASLQELLGGTPAHGSRNNFIFSMACYLRYVCNDDPNWIAQLLPTYGEATEKWRRTIDSACQRSQYRVMPQIVKRAIDQARHQLAIANKSEDEDANELPPEMPKRLPKLIAHCIKNVPYVCKSFVANAVFPALGVHLEDVTFELIDGTEKEPTFMATVMSGQSSGKSAANEPIKYILADVVEQDERNRQREQEWKDAISSKGSNKEKPKRPDDLCVQVLVSDMTNAAFVQRLKDANGKYLYTNLEELELLKQLQTNGTKDIGKIICLCFDNGMYGQERVGAQSITARVKVRWNWNAATTVQKGIQFFKGRLVDGTLSRVNILTIFPDKTKPFVYGRYDEHYAEVLKPYIINLKLATGLVECKQALALARKMSEMCAEEGALSDDPVYQDLSYRAVTIAYMKAMVLYIANGMTWTKEIADFAVWSLKYDLWCKSHFFGELLKEEKSKEKVKKKRGRQNLLELLPTTFSYQDAQEVRRLQGMDESGCRQMINSWTFRGYIELDPTLGTYIKTDQYLKRMKG